VVYEQYICVLKGMEQFRLVSPIYRQNLYIGKFDQLKQYDTPIDFFNPNYSRYPFAKKVNFIEATLNAGDCLYVPAFYYI